MTKRFIIHIGPHKTGTTSIQDMLYAHSLDERSNFVYPFTRPDQTGQHEFARLASDPEHPDFVGMLSTLASGSKTCILSSEEFCYLPVASIQKIRDVAPDADFTIVYYQRDVLSLLYSWWQELIKHGSVETLPKFLLNVISGPENFHLLVPDQLLDNWAFVFGRGTVRIFLYDQIQDVAQQFAADFIGVDLASEMRTVSNRSYGHIECEMMRLWNICGYAGNEILQLPNSHLMRAKISSESGKYVEDLNLSYNRAEFLSVEDALITRWGDRIEDFTGGQLFNLRERTYSYVSSDFWAANPDLLAIMREFADRAASGECEAAAESNLSIEIRSREGAIDAWNELENIRVAARQREQMFEDRLDKEIERVKALEIVILTLIASLRWHGLDRSRFKMLMTEVARSTPNDGKAAVRHEIYLRQAQGILSAL
jgi:hypothetical protein